MDVVEPAIQRGTVGFDAPDQDLSRARWNAAAGGQQASVAAEGEGSDAVGEFSARTASDLCGEEEQFKLNYTLS